MQNSRINPAPVYLNLRSKHLYYVNQLKLLDKDNNEIIETIQNMSNHSTVKKNRAHQQEIRVLQRSLDLGRARREVCRLKIRRLKNTIKNKNRVLNNGGKDFK